MNEKHPMKSVVPTSIIPTGKLRGKKGGEPVPIRSGKLPFNLGAYAPASFVLH